MNLLLFFAIAMVSLTLVLVAFRHSLTALYVVLAVLYLITNMTAGKIAMVDFYLFAIPASAAAPLYASIFLGTDMIAEHRGKRDAFRAVWFGFIAQISLVAIGFLIKAITAVGGSPISDSLDVLFGFAPRLVLGSVVAYLVAQHFDVWFYHKLKNTHGTRLLWLRNNASTILSQFIDSFLVFTIAFTGVIDNWVAVMFSTYVMKVVVALFDTPFLYLSRGLIRKEKRETE